jgi:uncharacterized membrane protein
MASQKQAKRRHHAVSPRKSAGHGNNRGRNQVSGAASAIAAESTVNGQAKASGSRAAAAPAQADDLAQSGRGGVFGWVRAHPLPFVTWLLSLFGLGVSIYLTIVHFDTSLKLTCPAGGGIVNCVKVTTSSQSMVFGIFPVAVLGLAFYVFMAAINSPLGWRLNRPEVKWIRLGSVVVGMGFVLYLIYAELIQIGSICLWCTSVHVATFLLFTLLVYNATSWNSTAAKRR